MDLKIWNNRRVVVTAGPTREALDPVRYLSNESSGRMGWALAETARQAGARVTLIAGPTALPFLQGVTTVPVTSAIEMLKATRKAARSAHAVVGAAAVADWRPAQRSCAKIKKGRTAPSLRLVANPDILKTLAQERRGPLPRLAGFALETQGLLANARKKMVEKSLDLIVANPPSALGGKETDAWLLRPGRPPEPFQGDKKKLAQRVWARLGEALKTHDR